MRRSSRDIKVGLFAAAAMAILVVFLAVLGGIKMWKTSNVYHIRFEESIAGLEKGSPVRIKGVKVGTVDGLRIPHDDITKVEVTIAVDADTPIKTNTEATIGSVGITGLRYIELLPGEAEARDLPPGSTITGTESFLSSISGTAESAILKAEVLIDNLLTLTSEENRERVVGMVQQISTLVRANSDDVSGMISEARGLTEGLRKSTEEISTLLEENREGLTTVIENMNEVAESSRPFFAYIGNEETIRKLDDIVSNSNELALRLNTLIGDNHYALDQALVDLRESSRNLNEFTNSIRMRPSLLLRGAAVGPRVVED